jgi:pantoate--beta-alanine ligase
MPILAMAKSKNAAELRLCKSVEEYTQWRNAIDASAAERIGFVPTMGALHEGHMALIAQAKGECEKVVVSIFVNPLQFAPHEDFSKYPRPFERDLKLCEEAGVDAVFCPQAEELYGSDREDVTKVVPPASLTELLEGTFRPGFFTGVATVVCKLFNIIRPNTAYFGEKDYQQLQVICRMVKDLNMPITIEPVAIVREKDGLALSSRNVYLSQEQRRLAPILNETLRQVRDAVLAGAEPETAVEEGRRKLSSTDGIALQYLELCDRTTLERAKKNTKDFVVLVAAKLGDVRLIDNVISR